jgi:tight adherence protein B
MILSSSLKAGLSLRQAMEVLVEEMPAPINQEFGMVLKEESMGS